MNNFERKYSKYAIPNLSLVLIIIYGIGYLISMVNPNLLLMLSLNPYEILHGQIWRIISWVFIPPSGFDIFVLITLFFYYSIGKSLERVWGDWLYNVYIFSGIFFTVIASFIMYGVMYFTYSNAGLTGTELDLVLQIQMAGAGLTMFSTYYINMSIFLAFAMTFPDTVILLMFIIPVKMKWLGVIYGAMIGYEIIVDLFNSVINPLVNHTGSVSVPIESIVIGASLLNFIVFFVTQRKRIKGSPMQRFKQARRRQEFSREVQRSVNPAGISKHKCAICGQTEMDAPDLQFRFCSRCNGNYEYCEKHLFTHTHVE